MQQSKVTPARKYAKGMGKAVADRTVNRRFLREFKRKTWIKLSIGASPATDEVQKEVKEWAKENEYKIEKYTVIGKRQTNKDPDLYTVDVKILVIGKYETEEWEDVAERVAIGNTSLISLDGPDPSNIDRNGKSRSIEFTKLNHHLRQASVILSGRHLQHGDETQSSRNQEVFTNCSTAAASFISFYLLLNGSGVGRSYDDDMMVVDWSKAPHIVCVIDQTHKDVQSGEITCLTPDNARTLICKKKYISLSSRF
jgi:hypothetical protein